MEESKSELVYDLITKYRGNLSKISDEMKQGRTAVQNYIRSNSILTLRMQEVREAIVDKAEDNIFDDVDSTDAQARRSASHLVVSTLGRERGWTTRVDLSMKEPIQVQIRRFDDGAESGGKAGPDQNQSIEERELALGVGHLTELDDTDQPA